MQDVYMEIGGELPSNLIEEFHQALVEDNAAFDWADNGPPDLSSFKRALEEWPDISVDVMANNVMFGMFENLEAFCRNNNLQYCRWTDPSDGCEYLGEVVWWNPEMSEPKRYANLGGRTPAVTIEDLEFMLVDGSGSAEEKLARIEEFVQEGIPEIEGFKVVK